MNEGLSDKEREQFAIKRKETLLKETKKGIDMLVDQYALAYSTKDKEMKFMARYYDTVREMKEKIITYDPRFFSFVMDSKMLSSQEKLSIYNENKEFLDTLTDEGLNDYLAKPNNFLNNPKLLFSVRAEKIIREYFEKASGTSFDEFEKQCAKLASSFIIMSNEYAQRESPVSSEPTNFDPKKEIQAMYKQLNKNDELKEQKKEQIKEQLIKYFTEQLKEQKSFYDVSASEIFAKWSISNMTDMFKKNPEKVEINLETIKTKVLEDRKKELEKELKKEKKIFKNFKDVSKTNFISAIGPIKEANLKELTVLHEELKVRKQLKQAEKHFGIKWKKIFGKETVQVKKEFRDLLRSEDSLVTAVKTVQQYFPSTYEPEKTKIVQQSLAAQIEKASANSEKNKPEEKAANLKVNPQNTVSETLIQRSEYLENLENQTDRMVDGAQAFSEVAKKLQQSNRKGLGLRRIRQLIKPQKQATPVTRTDEQNQEDKLSRKSSQQSEVSSTRSNSLTSSIQAAPASTTRKENKGINFPRFQQANWNSWMVRLPALRQLVKPMPMTTAAKVDKYDQEDTLLRNFGQQKIDSIERSNSQNTSFQRRQHSTVSRKVH